MTIDEAIKHYEEVADTCEFEASKYDMTDAYESHIACQEGKCAADHRQLAEWLKELKKLREQTRWIPVSESLPENTKPVNITWVNHNPVSYYADIKDKPFVATGHYCKGKWWWYSVTCQDYLNEYGRCDVDAMDDDIEVIAWMPLPKPYQSEVKKC